MKTNLKTCIVLLALLGTLPIANAQERLSREEALKLAFAASLDLGQLQGTPIPTDVDLKQPIAVREGDYGGLFLPEGKLTVQAIASAGEKVLPIGQLWLHKLTPMHDGQPVDSGKLRMATVQLEGSDVRVPQCTIGLRKSASGSLQMLVFGKSAEPVAVVPVNVIEGQAKEPVSLEAEVDSSGGTATIVLFGKYRARLAFTELES